MSKDNQDNLPGLTNDSPHEQIVPGARLAETLDYYRRRGWTVHSLAMVPGSLSHWRVLVSNRTRSKADWPIDSPGNFRCGDPHPGKGIY